MNKLATIILAAGKGTRMKSDKPKVVFEIADKPLINRVVDTASSIKSDQITIVVGYKKEIVMDTIGNLPNISFVEQKEQNGTGHAVMVTEENFKDFTGDVIILCGDVPLLREETLKSMLILHRNENAACTVLTAKLENPAKYGRIVRNSNGVFQKIIEFKDASESQKLIKEINTGIYCFKADLLFDSLKKINNYNNQNEYYLTDTLELLAENHKVISMNLEDISEAAGVNSQLQLAELEDIYNSRIRTKFLNNGVIIQNPNSVIIGDEVSISNDVTISPNSIIKGKSIIEKGCQIGPNTLIVNSHIKENSKLKGFNILENCSLPASTILEFRESQINE